MRKVYVDVVTRITMNMDDGVDVSDVISDMDYEFTSPTEACDFEDTEIKDYNVIDSK